MDWIKYHSHLQTTNNIICVFMSMGFLESIICVFMSKGFLESIATSVLPKVISGLCTTMPRDNSNGLFTIFNCSRTTPLMSSTTTMPKDNSNGLQSTFAKDNSFGLREIGTIDNDMLHSTWGQAKSFVILFPMWGKNGSKFLPFSLILLATYT